MRPCGRTRPPTTIYTIHAQSHIKPSQQPSSCPRHPARRSREELGEKSTSADHVQVGSATCERTRTCEMWFEQGDGVDCARAGAAPAHRWSAFCVLSALLIALVQVLSSVCSTAKRFAHRKGYMACQGDVARARRPDGGTQHLPVCAAAWWQLDAELVQASPCTLAGAHRASQRFVPVLYRCHLYFTISY